MVHLDEYEEQVIIFNATVRLIVLEMIVQVISSYHTVSICFLRSNQIIYWTRVFLWTRVGCCEQECWKIVVNSPIYLEMLQEISSSPSSKNWKSTERELRLWRDWRNKRSTSVIWPISCCRSHTSRVPCYSGNYRHGKKPSGPFWSLQARSSSAWTSWRRRTCKRYRNRR